MLTGPNSFCAVPIPARSDFCRNVCITPPGQLLLFRYMTRRALLLKHFWWKIESNLSIPYCSWDIISVKTCSPVLSATDSYLLSVSASRGPVFQRYLLNGQIDQDETLAQGVSAHDLIFHYIVVTKNENFMVLPLAPNVKNCDMAQYDPFAYWPPGRGQRSG